MKIPTPREGWRVFAGEVGVIVLGVLIALGAQQIADDWQKRADARAFSETIDHEIALNLASYDIRARQSTCVIARLKQLEAWMKRSRTSGATGQIQPVAPANWSFYRSAWDNRDPEAFRELPLERRLKYAEFYDELANNEKQITRESELWLSLFNFYVKGPVSIGELRTAMQTFAELDVLAYSIPNNIHLSKRIAGTLGIKQGALEGVSPEFERYVTECLPLEATGNTPKT